MTKAIVMDGYALVLLFFATLGLGSGLGWLAARNAFREQQAARRAVRSETETGTEVETEAPRESAESREQRYNHVNARIHMMKARRVKHS